MFRGSAFAIGAESDTRVSGRAIKMGTIVVSMDLALDVSTVVPFVAPDIRLVRVPVFRNELSVHGVTNEVRVYSGRGPLSVPAVKDLVSVGSDL